MYLSKGRTGSALMGSLRIVCVFDRGAFWVLPLTHFCIPKSAGADLFPDLSKIVTFAATLLVRTPFVRDQTKHTLDPGYRTVKIKPTANINPAAKNRMIWSLG